MTPIAFRVPIVPVYSDAPAAPPLRRSELLSWPVRRGTWCRRAHTLSHHLVVDQHVVALSENERQQPAILVAARGAGLDFQPRTFAFQKVGREPAGISTVILHMLAALGYLECIHDDQPHLVGLAVCGPAK